MYEFSWSDIDKVLTENGVHIQYEGDKVIGVSSSDIENELAFSIFSGKISAISLSNERVSLNYSVTDTEVHLNMIYGKRSATVINENETVSN